MLTIKMIPEPMPRFVSSVARDTVPDACEQRHTIRMEINSESRFSVDDPRTGSEHIQRERLLACDARPVITHTTERHRSHIHLVAGFLRAQEVMVLLGNETVPAPNRGAGLAILIALVRPAAAPGNLGE